MNSAKMCCFSLPAQTTAIKLLRMYASFRCLSFCGCSSGIPVLDMVIMPAVLAWWSQVKLVWQSLRFYLSRTIVPDLFGQTARSESSIIQSSSFCGVCYSWAMHEAMLHDTQPFFNVNITASTIASPAWDILLGA